jgi:hypothetical protein
MMIGNLMWLLSLITPLFTAMFVQEMIKKKSMSSYNQSKSVESKTKLQIELNLNQLIFILEKAFWFFEIMASKFIGLLAFLLANILTLCANLAISPPTYSTWSAEVILLFHSSVSTFLPFLYYKLKYFRQSLFIPKRFSI